MFFPNRILYREELLSTTVTYAVDLSETEFLHLKPIVPIEQLGIRPAEFRLYEVADKILGTLCDKRTRLLGFGQCRYSPDGGYTITDGNHRSVARRYCSICPAARTLSTPTRPIA